MSPTPTTEQSVPPGDHAHDGMCNEHQQIVVSHGVNRYMLRTRPACCELRPVCDEWQILDYTHACHVATHMLRSSRRAGLRRQLIALLELSVDRDGQELDRQLLRGFQRPKPTLVMFRAVEEWGQMSTPLMAPLELPEPVINEIPEPVRKYDLWVRLDIDPDRASRRDERLTLLGGSLETPTYRQSAMVKDDMMAGDAYVDIVFEHLMPDQSYWLEVEARAAGESYFIFEDVSWTRLMSVMRW